MEFLHLEVRGHRKGLPEQTHVVLYIAVPGLIACEDVFAVTFTIASLYSLIIEQFQHKI